jgi:hypothetical protein
MKISQLKEYLAGVLAYNLTEFERHEGNPNAHNNYVVPFVVGDPGVGKTAAPRQVARAAGLPYHQTIVAQYDPGELAGLPFMGEVEVKAMREVDGHMREVTETRTRMIRLRPSYLPDPEKADGVVGVYNLDELPQAMLASQNVMAQLVNEWRIGEHMISRGITIVATGNKPENKAGTTTMPTHLRDRLNFVTLDVDLDDSLAYFNEIGVDPLIRAYLKTKGTKALHRFEVGANAYPTPRSWEKTNAFLHMDLSKAVREEAIRGQIGDGEGHEFNAWLRVKDKMPDIDALIANPESKEHAPVFGNSEPDVAYLVVMSVADRVNAKTIGDIIKYVRRLPNQEFAAVWAGEVKRRDPTMLQTKEMTDWKMKDGAKLML